MAQGINTVALSGNLTRDPMKWGEGDKVRAGFSIAVNGRGDDVAYVDMVAFGALAEKVVLPYCAKGTGVAVVGRISTYQADDRGEKRTRTNVIVDQLTLLPKGGDGGSSNGGGQAQQQAPAAAQSDPVPF